MGVILQTKHHINEYHMGYISFFHLRNDIMEYLGKGEQVKPGTISFLSQSDCGGKLTYKESRELLKDIENMPNTTKTYGSALNSSNEYLTINSFKEMLQDSAKNRCILDWG